MRTMNLFRRHRKFITQKEQPEDKMFVSKDMKIVTTIKDKKEDPFIPVDTDAEIENVSEALIELLESRGVHRVPTTIRTKRTKIKEFFSKHFNRKTNLDKLPEKKHFEKERGVELKNAIIATGLGNYNIFKDK